MDSRRIIAAHFGAREQKDAYKFLEKIPQSYLKNAMIDTDGLSAYVIPFLKNRVTYQQWVGNKAGMTNGIERFNLTLRSRLARLHRKTLKFSKSQWFLERAVMSVIHDYNERDAPRLALARIQRRQLRQAALRAKKLENSDG